MGLFITILLSTLNSLGKNKETPNTNPITNQKPKNILNNFIL
jgi:hypothetical protein